MLEEKFEIEFTHGLPLKDSPYPGLNPSTYTLKKGAVVKPGRMPLGCDVLVNQDVKVEMRDGINIYIDIFKPTKKGQYPTIMWYAPYGKRDSLLNMDAFNHPTRMDVKEEWEDGLNGFEAPNPSYWVSHGYVVVAPDPRGVGSSEGNAYAWGSKNAEDEYDLIEWISNQDWSNGSVGTTGTSYLAMSQYKVATLNPPSLKAIAPWEGALSPYAESFARGGISDFSFSDSLSKLIYTDTMLEDTKAMFQKYPFFNDYWKDKNSDLSQVEIPAYIVGSWTNAIHSKGATEAFQQIKSKKKWLRIHNTHEWNDYYNPEHVEDLRRFFDFYLKNSDNGWESTPKVRMTVLNPGHEDIVDRVEEHYPQDNQGIEKLYLSEDNHALSLSNSNDNDEKFVVLNTKDDGMTFQILMSESREYIGNLH